MNKTALTWYRRLLKAKTSRQAGYILSGRLESNRLKQVIDQNRHALGVIREWFPAGLIEGSVFRYGVNPEVEPLLNLKLDTECTHTDLLVYFCQTSPAPRKYLELGVSVGKTFWQVLNGCAGCECWGFDIEELNPVLKNRLTLESREEWNGPPNSIKKTASSLSRFIHSATGNKVVYVCADIFDPRAWQLLAGQNFNVVLSDALHTPEALEFEWSQMIAMNIFHPQNVVVMWDDLDGKMRDWFMAKHGSIARDLFLTDREVGTLYMNGWLGRREFPHRLGLAFKRADVSQT